MRAGAVVTPHHLSALAGMSMLESGGNAVDAAVAAVAAQGAVAPETSGIGGDLFALIHKPGWDRPKTLNASGRAGSNASSAQLRDDGATEIPRDNPLAVTVPGCVDGLSVLTAELATMSLPDLLDPAIALADRGFEVSAEQEQAFGRMADAISTNPAVSSFYPGGRPISRGDHVTRKDLAETLRGIAAEGRDYFYLGRPAEDIVTAVDGLITQDDLAGSHTDWIEPIGVAVGGLSAWTVPPNSQGYLGPATLAVLKMLDPPEDPDDPMHWHLLIEAYRALAWERNDVVADPDHAPLPPDLLVDPARLERAASTVSRTSAGVWPDRIGGLAGTAYMCASDSEGMAVSIIQSNYRGIGSTFGAARSGFMLHDRGGGFGLTPGHPNELAPGKRPLHTLSPTLWTDGPNPAWTIGTRGGAVQPQLVAQVAARAVLAGHDLDDAQAESRWTVQDFGPGAPPNLSVEPDVPTAVVQKLAAMGHQVTTMSQSQPGWGPVSMIDLTSPTTRAAADPRVETATALLHS